MIAPVIPLITGLIQLAPSIAALIGKGEEEAKLVANVAKKIAGTEDDNEALAAFRGNPELLLQLKAQVYDYEKSLEQNYVDDKANARARDTEFLKAGTRNYRSDFLVAVSVIVVFTILGVVILVPELNEYAKGALTTILGVFLNQLTNVFSFEFGTTRKADEKNSAIVDDYIKR